VFSSHITSMWKLMMKEPQGREIDVSFHGELRFEQRDAIEQVLAHDHGILCAPTAFGKNSGGKLVLSPSERLTL